eukprot:m.120153 g.120153  ORF g.120153 m.120153 type:complete len:87 (+) comp21831_c0_seq3:165-425(+)
MEPAPGVDGGFDILHCSGCTNPNGDKMESSIDVTTCDGMDIGNHGGELRCDEPLAPVRRDAGEEADPAVIDTTTIDPEVDADRHEL